MKGRQRKKQQKNTVSKGQVRDVNNWMVLKDPLLCAQFLRDYAGIPLLGEVRPGDIEDVSKKYQAYLGVSFETDTVKKIRIRGTGQGDGKGMPLYMVSLVEHKSQVDYNVAMQLLRYMVCIWNEYGKEMERGKRGKRTNKNFRYPPILPIVYYEGAAEWTAGLRLKDRIMMNDVFGDYLPDFTYKLIRIHDYTNEELLDKEDEMSLLMMINKMQNAEDMKGLWEGTQGDKINGIIRDTPEPTLEVIISVVWSLLMKLNVPVGEAKKYVGKMRKRQMGYWFENMEKMDIQEERRKTAKARKELGKARRKLEKAQKEAAKMRKETEEVRKETEEVRKETEEVRKEVKDATETRRKLIRAMVSLCQEFGTGKDAAIMQVMEGGGLTRSEAEEQINCYWKEE